MEEFHRNIHRIFSSADLALVLWGHGLGVNSAKLTAGLHDLKRSFPTLMIL